MLLATMPALKKLQLRGDSALPGILGQMVHQDRFPDLNSVICIALNLNDDLDEKVMNAIGETGLTEPLTDGRKRLSVVIETWEGSIDELSEALALGGLQWNRLAFTLSQIIERGTGTPNTARM